MHQPMCMGIAEKPRLNRCKTKGSNREWNERDDGHFAIETYALR